MSVKLYYSIICPNARAALITFKHLGIDGKLVAVDLLNGGTRTSDYLKINPTHTVPSLVDNDGFTLFESRAVVTYLVGKYGPSTGLYPAELQARANVDKIIFFDVTSFVPALMKSYFPIYLKKQEPTQESLDELTDKLNILETILGDKKFFTGDNVTVADISISVSVPYLKLFLPKYYSEKLRQWYERVVAAIPAVGEVNGQAEKAIQEQQLKKA